MTNKKKFSIIQITRAFIQLISFLLIPQLFITVFSSIGGIYKALLGGTFTFSAYEKNIILVVIVFLITFLWGRFFCGFLCSFGAMQDLLWQGGKHIPLRTVISEKTDGILKYLKYAVLLFIVVGVWTFSVTESIIWSPWTVFGMYASPWKGLPSQMMFLSVGGLLLLLTIIGSLFIERFFCKYLCPLGALFSIVSHFRIFRINRNSRNCNGHCRLCSKKCSMSIPLYQYDSVKSGECIRLPRKLN